MDIVRVILGITVFVGLAWFWSERRSAVSWRLVLAALGLQFVMGFLVLKVPAFAWILERISEAFVRVIGFANQGAAEVFGRLTGDAFEFGTVIGFRVIPSIIFFSALAALLYHFGVLQRVVRLLSWVMQRTMKLSGAESLAVSANVFVGQTEAPLMVKPYLERMTRSEIMALMTGGMATIAGTVMAAYIGFLGGDDPAQQVLFGKHLLTASLLSAPAALLYAKILVPETETIVEQAALVQEDRGTNLFDAIARGTTDGLRLAFNVAAMLIVFIALVGLVNYVLSDLLGASTGLNGLANRWSGGVYEAFSLELLFGLLMAPLAWLMGVGTDSALVAGQLLGEKWVLNEFVAYLHLADLKASGALTDERAIILLTYALCGFANFGSMGIQIGGISALAPNQRPVLCQLAFRSVFAGNLACLTTACIAGLLI